MSAETSIKRRFLNLRTLISFALALSFILFLLLRLDVDLKDTYERIISSRPLPYLLAFPIYYATFPLRAWRWRLLLENAGERQVPTAWRLTPIMLTSFFVNTIAYARLGDAYRAYLLREETGAGFTRAVGTVVAERMMDLMVVVSLIIIAGLGAWQGRWGTVPYFGLGLVGLVGLFLLLLSRLGPWLVLRLPARLSSILASFQQGVLGSFRRLPFIAMLSVAIWLLETSRLFLVAAALDIQVNPMLLLFTAQAIALLVAVPFTPAGIGVVEPGVAGILMWAALTKEEAWSMIIMDRTVSYLSLIVVGLGILLLREVRRLMAPPSRGEHEAAGMGERGRKS